MPMASSDAGVGLIQSQESQLLISEEEIINMGEAEIAIAKQPSASSAASLRPSGPAASTKVAPEPQYIISFDCLVVNNNLQ